MLDSGTPFFMSKEIAWTAEFPKDENDPRLFQMKTSKTKNQFLSNPILLLLCELLSNGN